MAAPHRELMQEAIARDADGQRALLTGDRDAARAAFREAAELYRRSWEEAPPGSYGRLLGMLKSAVLAGGATREAQYARNQVRDEDVASPAAAYVRAIAALVEGDDGAARAWAERMSAGSEPFARTARAIAAVADQDQAAYAEALSAIVRDFERREQHLTGVPIADTALMLEALGEAHGMTAAIDSPLLPRA
jgi:hypothetical protein